MQLSANFTLAELTVTKSGLANVPGPAETEALRLLATKILQPLRLSLGKPIVVSSGYRSPAVNKAVNGATTSQHRFGEAVDFTVPGMTTREICERIISMKLPFDQLIEEFGRWVHVSYGPRQRRQVLRARTIGGKTQYLSGLA